MVADVFSTMELLDEDRDTLAFFMSDNGHIWGEHHLSSKRWPYVGSIEIPLLVRWPSGMKARRFDSSLVANIDVMPTVLDVLGIWPNEAFEADGRSLLSEGERGHLLLENWFYQRGAPSWASTLTKDWQFIEYYDTEGDMTYQEYYDLEGDPFQLENLLADRDSLNDPDIRKLSRMLADDRDCELGRCP
jgi:arylsulfatase A-like enzyme